MSDNCEKSETPVIYECPQCGSDETPQRQHFGGPKDGRNKECYCKNCGLSGFIEDFRIDWHYCPLCDEKYRDAEDLGLHLVRDHDANEDTAGDSTTLDQGPCEESAAASDIPVYGWFNEDPLVRLQDAIIILEEHRDRYEERRKKAFDNYMQAESEKNRRVHQSVAAQNQDRVETLEKILEEFTQQLETGDTE